MTASSLLTVVHSLSFQEDRSDLLRAIPATAWPGLLALTDEARLTLALAVRCNSALPQQVRERVAQNLKSNRARHQSMLAEYRTIAGALADRGVQFLALKGLTHWPFFADDPAHRPQYDFDFFCPPGFLQEAAGVLRTLGYESLRSDHSAETDHLPAMIRRNGFQWKNDYFDPDLPPLVEFHFRFWNSRREPFPVRSAESFWERRVIRQVGDLEIPSLHPVDGLSYATWHMMRHLLRGDLRLCHVYEIAHFLDRTAEDDTFWREWAETCCGRGQLAESLAFRVAATWFGCRMHPVAAAQTTDLPAKAERWCRLFVFSPVVAQERLNKDELFLHLSLIPRFRDRVRIASTRIFPRNPPRVVLNAHSPDDSPAMEKRRTMFRAAFLGRRALRHAFALGSVLRSTLRWWRQS